MKVLHLCAVAFGLETLLLPQIDHLRSRGLEVQAVCSPDPRVSGIRARGYTVHEIEIDRRILPVRNATSVARLADLMRRERYDLVHTHAPVASVLGRTAAKIARVPRIVYTAHGFYFHENMPALKYAAFHGIEKAFGRITDRILVQSQEDYQTAIDTRIGTTETVSYLGNGIDLRRFEPGRSDSGRTRLRTELGIPHDRAPVIGITGRITEEKGFRELVLALSELQDEFPDIHLLVIGGQLSTERDAFERELVAFIESHDLRSRVTFAGFRDDVADLLALLDLFVLPSYREGLPRSVLEAMAMELPVVATRIRGCREAVVDGETGLLVPPRDSTSLAGAMREVLAQPALARQLGIAGRKRVVAHYDEKLVFERLQNCYEDLGVELS